MKGVKKNTPKLKMCERSIYKIYSIQKCVKSCFVFRLNWHAMISDYWVVELSPAYASAPVTSILTCNAAATC